MTVHKNPQLEETRRSLVEMGLLKPVDSDIPTIVLKEKQYDLWVRFGGSEQQLQLCRGTHKECLHATDIFYRFIVQQGKIWKPQLTYSRQVVTPDRIIVGFLRNSSSYSRTGLWATFIIEEVSNV